MGKAVVGEILSYGNPGDRVWVKLGSKCFQATAATEINAGIASITIDEQGQAWAWCSSHPQTTRDRTTEFLKIVPEPPVPEPPGNIKVLFYIPTTQGYDWYIGGDRPTPVKIYQSTILPSSAHLSNTGRGLNSWVVGMHFGTQVVNIYPNNIVYTCAENWAYLLSWKGCGFWESEMYTGTLRCTVINSPPAFTGYTPDPGYPCYSSEQSTSCAIDDPLGETDGSASGAAHFEGFNTLR